MMNHHLPPHLLEKYRRKLATADEAIKCIRSGDRVYIGSNCGQPVTLCEAMVRRKNELYGVEVVHLLTAGPAPYVNTEMAEHFRHLAFFIGANVRAAVQAGHADYAPIFLSEIPELFKSRQVPLDVAMIAVSPPDQHGYFSMGVSVDIGLAACHSANFVLCEVNKNMPRTLGDGFLHIDEIDCIVEADYPVLSHPREELDEVSLQIGRHIATLIDDGACLQTGIGKIPSAVLACIKDKNDLGVHTEMFSDAVVELIENGNINCRKKTLHPNKVVATFAFGTSDLYPYIDNNPFFEFMPTEYVNDPFVVAQNDNMVAINSCIEVDLTGQVVSDSIGTRFYSGFGGQVDFIRGAARSKGGRPIIAFESTAKNGEVSRIVPMIKPGAGVVTSRADVHYVVTEYGVAYLHGKSIRHRALALIQIAHPKFRDWLTEEAKKLGYLPADQPTPATIYPTEYVQEVTLRNGQVITIRPIKPTDEQLLKKHFYSLSPQAVERRFRHMVRALSNATVRDLVNVDYHRHMAMVAVLPDGEGERILATARYYLDEKRNTAELAFAVLDDWQNLGIGRALFEALCRRACEDRIEKFEAYVQPDNAPMLRVLMNSGYPIEQTMKDDIYLIRLDLRCRREPRNAPAA